MPRLEEDLIDRLTTRPEVREKARALLRTVHSKTGPGTGYDIGDAKSGLPAICAYVASKSAGYADITQEVAQKASCLAPKTFVSTLRTVKTALLTPSHSKEAGGDEVDPISYATLIRENGIRQSLQVEKWMKKAQAALVALPRFQRDFASRLVESSAEVRIAVFYWMCRVLKISRLSNVHDIPLVKKHGVSLKDFNSLIKIMNDECTTLVESINARVEVIRKKMAEKKEASAAASAPASTSKTPTSTPSHSRSASPTKSAMRRDANLTTTPSSLASSVAKRKVKVAFSLSDIPSASEDDQCISDPETPSKKKRPRRASSSSASATRVMPMSKAQLASVASSSSEGGEDVEMADAAVLTPSKPKRRLVAVSASASSASPIAGPSTPRRPTATPTHAYRTPPSARIQLLSRLTDDEDNDAEEVEADVGVGVDGAEASEEDCDDDALPPSRRFRPVFLDRAQWAQRAPRLAHDRAAAEKRTRELAGRWGHPIDLLRHASAAEVPAT